MLTHFWNWILDPPPLVETLIFALIAILGFISAVISSGGPLFKENWLSKTGVKAFYVAASILLLALWQLQITNHKDVTQKIQASERDSIIVSQVDSLTKINIENIANIFSNAFANQGQKLESINNLFSGLRDSINNLEVESIEEEPLLIVKGDGIAHEINGDTINFTITINSIPTSSTIEYIDVFVEWHYSDGSIRRSPILNLVQDEFVLPRNQPVSYLFGFADIYEKVNSVNIALLGSYHGRNNDNLISMRDVYTYSFGDKEDVGFLTGDAKRQFLLKYDRIINQQK